MAGLLLAPLPAPFAAQGRVTSCYWRPKICFFPPHLAVAAPCWAADCRRSLASVNSAGAGLTGLALVLGSVGVDSQDIQVCCRT